MQKTVCAIILYSSTIIIKAEERLSWFTTDEDIKKNINVPDNLSEGKEENRALPWVFHDMEEKKIMELKCIMRGFNDSNNPSMNLSKNRSPTVSFSQKEELKGVIYFVLLSKTSSRL